MGDQYQEGSIDKTADLLTTLPFMVEFPFGEYKISMIERGEDFIKLGISPILVEEFGDTGKIKNLNFYYTDGDSDVLISMYVEDIEWISQESVKVKKIDALNKALETALRSNDLLIKIKAIKESRKFSKILNCDYSTRHDLSDILNDFLKIHNTVLQSKIKLGLQKLSEAMLKSTEFSEKQFNAVSAFLNFQIHYVKILLGIVIASKIY